VGEDKDEALIAELIAELIDWLSARSGAAD
jgi:hypothetical protein